MMIAVSGVAFCSMILKPVGEKLLLVVNMGAIMNIPGC